MATIDGAPAPGRDLVATWFTATHPNRCWAEAVLDGRLPGRSWTIPGDDDPAACVVEAGEKFCLIGGRVDEEVVGVVAADLRERSRAAVVLPPSAEVPAEPPDGYEAVPRAHFRTAAAVLRGALTAAGAAERRARLERDGLEVRRLEAEDFDDPLVHATMQGIYGTAERFGAGPDLGFCAVDAAGRVASWLHPVIGRGVAEVGAGTRPDHRGRGISAALNYLTVRGLALAGYDVTASWDRTNAASARLAGHVALEHEADYIVLVPRT